MNIHTYDFVSTPGFEVKITPPKKFDLCKHGGLDPFWVRICDHKTIVKEHPFEVDSERSCYGKPICLNGDCPYFKMRDEE